MKNSRGSRNVELRFDTTIDEVAKRCSEDPSFFADLRYTVGVGKTWFKWFCEEYNLVETLATWEKKHWPAAKWVFSMSEEIDLIRKNAKAQIKAINEQIRQLELAKDDIRAKVLKQTGKHLKG